MNNLKTLKAEYDKAKQELQDTISSYEIPCTHCRVSTPLKKLTVLRDHWYVEPYSCAGGAYWTEDTEVKWKCPDCDKWNRIYAERFNCLKPFFGQQEKTHAEKYTTHKDNHHWNKGTQGNAILALVATYYDN